MFGFKRNPKPPYESPAEYTPPTQEETYEYVINRQKPDKPVDFGTQVTQKKREIEEERWGNVLNPFNQ